MNRALRWVLGGAATIIAAVLVARFVIGPFTIGGLAVNAPLNGEGALGAIVTLMLAMGAATSRGSVAEPQGTAPSTAKSWPVTRASLVAFVALLPSLWVGFVSDDFIVVDQARAWTAANFGYVFSHPGGDGFFRPLGYVSWAIDGLYAGESPVLWHLMGVVLHTANAALVALLAQRLGGSNFVALVAGALFALHGSHLEANVWVAGRFDLLATLFALGALLAFRRNLALSLTLMLAAVWSKEAAYTLPLIVALLAWHGRPAGRGLWMDARGLRTAVPYFVVAGAAFAYRWWLLGGIGGYSEADGTPSAFAFRPAAIAKILFARLWTTLYFPVNWSRDPAVFVGLAAVLYLMALVWLAWRGQGDRRFGVALGMLMASILPPLHLLGGASDLSGGRLLYFPSVFFCILLALAIDRLAQREAMAVAAAVLLFHAALLQHDFRFWHATSAEVRAICRDAATGRAVPINLPRLINGVPALANGFAECASMERRTAAE